MTVRPRVASDAAGQVRRPVGFIGVRRPGGIDVQCGGQGVARLEGAAVLASLARRVERIEVAGEPKHLFNNTVRGLASLPVILVPAKD